MRTDSEWGPLWVPHTKHPRGEPLGNDSNDDDDKLAWFRGAYAWGGGEHVNGYLVGGIYLASTVAGSTRLWNARVDDPGLIGPLGDVGHLTDRFGDHTDLDAGELCWLTDRTPHMPLPLNCPTHRQFFRLVTEGVNVWYAKHSTPNPLGIVPPDNVRIIEEDKFAWGGGSASSLHPPLDKQKKKVCWCAVSDAGNTALKHATTLNKNN